MERRKINIVEASQGNLKQLRKEVKFIQDRFVTSKKTRLVDDISRVLARFLLPDKLSATIKFLDEDSSLSLLDLLPEILEGLKGNARYRG